jgi:ABC-type tungstate transport system substrate-binding protein
MLRRGGPAGHLGILYTGHAVIIPPR